MITSCDCEFIVKIINVDCLHWNKGLTLFFLVYLILEHCTVLIYYTLCTNDWENSHSTRFSTQPGIESTVSRLANQALLIRLTCYRPLHVSPVMHLVNQIQTRSSWLKLSFITEIQSLIEREIWRHALFNTFKNQPNITSSKRKRTWQETKLSSSPFQSHGRIQWL